jgi:hypothetical protein
MKRLSELIRFPILTLARRWIRLPADTIAPAVNLARPLNNACFKGCRLGRSMFALAFRRVVFALIVSFIKREVLALR